MMSLYPLSNEFYLQKNIFSISFIDIGFFYLFCYYLNMTKTKTTYLSLGSNLGDKFNNLQDALFILHKRVGQISSISNVYQTPALGFDGDDFLNACISIETKMNPNRLLDTILQIETELGRTRSNQEGYQSRSVDIDIIYYEYEVINTEELTIPHPKLQERRFVLKPLAEVAPQFYHPILNKDTRNLLQECRDKSKVTQIPQLLCKDRETLLSQIDLIAFEGNIGAGKTSLCKRIGQDYSAKLVLERFDDNPFLPKFYEDQSRYAFPLEMAFLADRYQQYTDDTSQFDLFKDFMVADYDIYKSLIFAKTTLQEEEYKLYRKMFHLMYKEAKNPDVYVYLYQNTERLLENIKKRGREFEKNITGDYLEKINRSYFDFIKGSPERNNLVIDISELDFVNRQNDYEFIMNKLQKYIISLSF